MRFVSQLTHRPPAAAAVVAEVITSHPFNNVTDSIFQKIGANLHQQSGHPLGILKGAIYDYFDTQQPGAFTKFDGLQPIVSAKAVRAAGGLLLSGACGQRLLAWTV